jgi:hypothetical protein
MSETEGMVRLIFGERFGTAHGRLLWMPKLQLITCSYAVLEKGLRAAVVKPHLFLALTQHHRTENFWPLKELESLQETAAHRIQRSDAELATILFSRCAIL